MKRSQRILARVRQDLYLLLVYGGLCMLALHLVLPDRQVSDWENRGLAGFPALSGITTAKVDDWFADQYPFRDQLFSVNYMVRRMMGISEINNVFIGWGRLIPNVPVPAANVSPGFKSALTAFAETSRAPVKVMLVPSAAGVYADKLPLGASVYDQDAWISSLEKSLPAGVDAVSVAGVLKENNDQLLYYKTDHHWTSLGAYYGFTAFAQAMDWTVQPPESYQTYVVASNFQGTSSSLTGDPFLQDKVEIMVAKDMPDYVMTKDGEKSRTMYVDAALDQKDKYEVFTGPNADIVRFEMDNDSDVRLLLVKDSFANSMVQFLIPYCRTITMVDPRSLSESLEQVMASDMINQVLVLYSFDSVVQNETFTRILD